ncbi:MAG: phage integrase N-terminal SAM-like domain-containing protein [Candidatus Sabulitectum sp.]|nr:phage integrase N-terminal SAM-like domain-containing protein [Candidatus Sabulitectum sp.]
MYVELNEFQDQLKKKQIVPEKSIKYFVYWIRQYLILDSPDEVDFSRALDADAREDWQIRQAVDAVRLYKYFSLEERPEDSCAEEDPVELVRSSLRVKHYSEKTIRSYCNWCRRYLGFCLSREFDNRADQSFRDYMTYLALNRKVAASTQNQSFNAVLFLFRNVWNQEPTDISGVRAKRPQRLPAVLSQEEVCRVFKKARGVPGLVVRMIYSGGMRLSEALALRIQDCNVENCSVVIRQSKSNKDRVTLLGRTLVPDLKTHINKLKNRLPKEKIPMFLPGAIARKYVEAGLKWSWQFVFPGTGVCNDPDTGKSVRYHLHPSAVQREMKRAVNAAGISKRATVHTMRH